MYEHTFSLKVSGNGDATIKVRMPSSIDDREGWDRINRTAAQVCEDAIRTNVIRLQNYLRGSDGSGGRVAVHKKAGLHGTKLAAALQADAAEWKNGTRVGGTTRTVEVVDYSLIPEAFGVDGMRKLIAETKSQRGETTPIRLPEWYAEKTKKAASAK